MVSRLLNLCGLYIGPENELNPPAPDNKAGFWENLRFVELNDEILASLGGGWDLPSSAPDGWELRTKMIPLRDRATNLIQRFDSREPWGWKDPRNSLTLPFWKSLIPDLKVVICLRHPLEVAKSLYKRGYSSEAFALRLWLAYNQPLLSIVAPENRVITHYDAYFHNTQAELQRILRLLDLPASEEKVAHACSATLALLRHHSVATSGLSEANLPPDVRQCYMAMCAEAGPTYRMSLGRDILSENEEIRSPSQKGAGNHEWLRQLQPQPTKEDQPVDTPEIRMTERHSATESLVRTLSSQLAQQTSKVQSLQRQIEVAAAATITASPNRIQVWDGSGLGETAIAYTFLEGEDVEVRVGSPDGPLFTRSGASGTNGTKTTGKWVTDGMGFFLQDVSEGKPLTQEHTLATVTVRVTSELAHLAEKEAQLERITSSFGWRLLNFYGRIKYRYLLPVYRLLRLLPSPVAQNEGLRAHIDTEIPVSLVIGKGNALYIAGWCYHSSQRIKKLHVVTNGVSHRVKTLRMGRRDVLATHFPRLDPNGYSYRSGFWTIVPLAEIKSTTNADLSIRATLANGETCLEKIANISLEPTYERREEVQLSGPAKTNSQPLIAICMATYNPRLDLFARQIQSILNQTHSNWICIISDDNSTTHILERMKSIVGQDKRFSIYPSQSRLECYRNFERCISLVPEEAGFVALCDQDDYWHSDKLEVLLSQFDDTTTLVYSDMNIVDDEGHCKSDTFWTTRPNNYRNLASLILANTITGAASLFPRRLLSHIIPFPQRIGLAYHDHWIGCVALAMGKVKYVNRPLHDYVQHSANLVGHRAALSMDKLEYVNRPLYDQTQHSANLVGHCSPSKETFLKRLSAFLKKPSDLLPYTRHAGGRSQPNLKRWEGIYFAELLRVKLICHLLELRCDPYLGKTKRKIVRRMKRIDESFLASTWLAIRSLRNVGRVSETLGMENRLYGAISWKGIWTLKSWLKTGAFVDGPQTGKSFQPAISQERWSYTSESEAPAAAAPPALDFNQIEFIQAKIAPLSLDVSHSVPRRVNLLIPTVDLRYVFGGYITKFNLARQLAKAGLNVRIVIVDHCEYLPSLWKRQLQPFQGLERLFERVEMAYAFDRALPLEVSEDDIFVATTWWTAHIAHQATKDLKKERFLYLIQEYEPFTFPMGTFACLAGESYSFPHYGIFSTELLRDYFRQNALGVFAEDKESGDCNSMSFKNAITSVGPVTREDIANRHPKKLLLYARPEDHAARNMFEMAVLALSEAIESGVFSGEWEFHGIGTVGAATRVKLSDGTFLHLLPRQSQESYRQVLRNHDLGLSLMYTPHPSLVPIEMASAGMLVVTNTYANKTADKMAAISPNIIAVEPTVESLTLGLKSAAENIEDFDRRIRGSNVQWSTSWDSSFDNKVTARIKEFIEAAC